MRISDWSSDVCSSDLVQHGKMMVELRMPGIDKGSAITAMLGVPPFAGHPPVFLGDDLTDAPGLAACPAARGVCELVGALRATAASSRLDNFAALSLCPHGGARRTRRLGPHGTRVG